MLSLPWPKGTPGEAPEHLDTKVRRIVDEQKYKATGVLTTHRDTLESLAKALSDDETAQGEGLQRILTPADSPSV